MKNLRAQRGRHPCAWRLDPAAKPPATGCASAQMALPSHAFQTGDAGATACRDEALRALPEPETK
jgi:hypothetical protein